MGQYRISDLNIEINTNSQTLQNNLKPFESGFDCKPNLVLSITDDILLQYMEEYEGYSSDIIELEYISTEYARALFDFNGFSFIASGVEYNGSAVMFSAPFDDSVNIVDSLKAHNLFVVNNPGVRLINSEFIAYGSPFGSKGDMSKDVRFPIKSIVYVDSERFDSLKKLDTKDMVSMFLRSVLSSIRSERTKHTLFMLEKLMRVVDFYGVGNLSDVDFILEHTTE